MSRFSLVNVIGRRTSASDCDARPSIISVTNLNRQLSEEKKMKSTSDPHLFFGPPRHVFDGKDRTRVIHGERTIQKNSKRVWLVSEPLSMDKNGSSSLVQLPSEITNRSSLLSGTFSAASKYLGQKVSQIRTPPSHINYDSFCDGCGMDPILGNMYNCSRCENYSLCEDCYETGVHGFESSELLRAVREDFALRRVMETCRNRVPEKVFDVLMKKVCKGQVDKFNFMSAWIANVVLGVPVDQLSVRGIEIPNLDNDARSVLVGDLTPVLAERNDLEICMEWFHPKEETSTPGKLETLRIWIATDKQSRSPFAETAYEPEGSDLGSPRSIGSPLPSPRESDLKPSVPGSPSTTAVTASPPDSPLRTHSSSDTSEKAESEDESVAVSDLMSPS